MQNNQNSELKQNPLRIFYKADPSVLVYLAEILTPRDLKVLLELLCGMDVANCFEPAGQTPRQYMELRFSLAKSDVNKTLKRFREMGIIACIENAPNALRVNPWIANKSKSLSGYWEFEDIKLKPLIESGYHDWLVDKGLMAINTLSRKRIKTSSRNDKTSLPTDRTLQDQMNQLIEEHAKDYENFLAEREENQVLIQTMQKQHEDAMQRLIEENRRERLDLKNLICEFKESLKTAITELKKHDPQAADKIQQRHLRVVRNDD